jgi:hypothetical protein
VAEPLKLFYSYSHKDEACLERLRRHLVGLVRSRKVEEWWDRSIRPGDDWDGAISEKLEQADVILLLVSPDFVASRYCYDVEAERAMARYREGSARVVPVILKSVRIRETLFADVQAVPRDLKAIEEAPFPDRLYMSVADEIATLVEQGTPPKLLVNPADGLEYVWIPPGRFKMGASPGDEMASSDETPAHSVVITRGFWLGRR